MIGQPSGLRTRIVLDDPPEFFTNGDMVRGRMIVESSKSFTAQNIEIKLRCEDYANVWVPNGQGGYYETETLRYLSLRDTLFPNKSVRFSTGADQNARYTLQAGRHEFDFHFQIPLADKYPQSIDIKGSDSGVKWYLKGVIHRGQVLAATKRVIKGLEMRPSSPVDYSANVLRTERVTTNMSVYLPGYAAHVKTPTNKLKGLITGNNQFRKRSEIALSLLIPEEGLQQDPVPLAILLDITSPDDNLLIVKQFEMQLKRKIVVSVDDGWYTDSWREFVPLIDRKDLNLPLKEAVAKLEEIIKGSSIKGRIPSSFNNKHFDVSYKLVVVVTLACKEKTTAVERIRLSTPIIVHNYLPRHHGDGRYNMYGQEEELPLYNMEPQIGESTFPNASNAEPGPWVPL